MCLTCRAHRGRGLFTQMIRDLQTEPREHIIHDTEGGEERRERQKERKREKKRKRRCNRGKY